MRENVQFEREREGESVSKTWICEKWEEEFLFIENLWQKFLSESMFRRVKKIFPNFWGSKFFNLSGNYFGSQILVFWGWKLPMKNFITKENKNKICWKSNGLSNRHNFIENSSEILSNRNFRLVTSNLYRLEIPLDFTLFSCSEDN